MGMATIKHIDLFSCYIGIHFSGCQLARFFASTFVKQALIKSQGTVLPAEGRQYKGRKDETHPSINNRTLLNNFHQGGIEGDV